MRILTALAAAGALSLLSASSARACGAVVAACPPGMPVYAPVVLRPVAPPLPLERSRFTGQPLTVVFNNPGSLPGLVDPGFTLVPLPRARPFHTRAVFPRGY